MSTRTPQHPSSFNSLYAQCVEKACTDGSLPIECSTKREAETLKFSFYRYFRSMQHYCPGEPLTLMCDRIMVRITEHILELTLKDHSPMAHNMERALRGESKCQGVDPVAKSVTGVDADFAELYRLEREGALPHQLEEHGNDEGTKG